LPKKLIRRRKDTYHHPTDNNEGCTHGQKTIEENHNPFSQRVGLLNPFEKLRRELKSTLPRLLGNSSSLFVVLGATCSLIDCGGLIM
jgi:hypothetical protein